MNGHDDDYEYGPQDEYEEWLAAQDDGGDWYEWYECGDDDV